MSSTLFGIVEELRDTATYYRGKRGVEWLLDRAATEIETLRSELDKVRNLAVGINDETKQLTEERNTALLKIGHIRNEIDCRIEHGADSNGHLEAIRTMIDNKDSKVNNKTDIVEKLYITPHFITADEFGSPYTMPHEITERNKQERYEAAREIHRLRFERDEARREVCMLASGKGGRSSSVSPDAIEYAQSRGWDCFKKDLTDDNS